MYRSKKCYLLYNISIFLFNFIFKIFNTMNYSRNNIFAECEINSNKSIEHLLIFSKYGKLAQVLTNKTNILKKDMSIPHPKFSPI